MKENFVMTPLCVQDNDRLPYAEKYISIWWHTEKFIRQGDGVCLHFFCVQKEKVRFPHPRQEVPSVYSYGAVDSEST